MARILLADDDASTRDLVRRALEADGHTVHVTQDGAEALDHIQKAAGAVDVLVSDVEMPLLDGVSLAEQAFPLNNKLRVLLMSGFAEQLERAKALKGPRVGVISKPFTLDQVRASVRSLLA